MQVYKPSTETLGKVKISVNPQCKPDGSGVYGNWLSNTETMSEATAISIAKNLIKQGVAVLVVPQYVISSEAVRNKIQNPSETNKECFWEWRSFNGSDFEFVLFELPFDIK